MIRQKLLQIRNLEYRSPRLAAAITVAFAVNGEIFQGPCKDVSDSGIRARFDRPVAIGDSGSLTLHYRDGAVTRRALVAYLEGPTVGLSFIPDDPAAAPHAIALVRRPASRSVQSTD